MQFEQETLEKVMQARSQVASARATQNIDALGQAEGALRVGLGNLFAVAEAYPELGQREKHWLSLTEAARLVDEAELMVLLATFKP